MKKIKLFIRNYNIIPIIIFTLFFMTTWRVSFYLSSYYAIQKEFYHIPTRFSTYDTIITICWFALLSCIIFSLLRSGRYHVLTGRSYAYDHDTYHRNYNWLVDYFKDADPQRMNEDDLPEISWHESSGIILGHKGKKLISFEPNTNGAVIFAWGAPGVGKTTSVIIPSARQWGLKLEKGKDNKYHYIQRGSVMCLDLKGDIYNANKKFRRIKRFSTIDSKHSFHYDPLITARKMNEDDLIEFMNNLAVILVPEERSADSDYFIKTARGFFKGIFLFCLHDNPDIGFSDICQQILLHTYREWGQRIEDSGYLPSIAACNRFKDENEKNVGGGYSKLCDSLQIYTSPTMRKLLVNDDKSISPNDLENCIDIYIQIDPNTMDVYAPLVALFFQVFMAAGMTREEGKNPPICYIIDEFGQLPTMPIIPKAAQYMRSYNASILISTQSIASIEQHYTTKIRNVLMDCAKAHVFLSVNDPDTRDWASRLIGTRKVLKVSTSHSKGTTETFSRSVSEDRANIFEPTAFSLLPDDHSVIIWKEGHYIKAKGCYYKD